MLRGAEGKEQDFTSQASAMQARVAEQERASRDALAAKKAAFEDRLSKQSEFNRGLEKANAGIRRETQDLLDYSSALRNESYAVNETNEQMRHVLSKLREKIEAAKPFLKDTLDITDDSNAKEILALKTTPAPTLDYFLKTLGGDEPSNEKDEQKAKAERKDESLLQFLQNPEFEESRPEDLIATLAKSLTDLEAAEKEGDAQLQARFDEMYGQAKDEEEALLEKQASLNETRETVAQRVDDLRMAKEHLLKTQKQLVSRLDGVKVFAQTISKAFKDSLKADNEAEQSREGDMAEASERRSRAREERARMVAEAENETDDEATLSKVFEEKGHDIKQVLTKVAEKEAPTKKMFWFLR